MNSPAGVPVASPRTVTWLPATAISLISHFRSGIGFQARTDPGDDLVAGIAVDRCRGRIPNSGAVAWRIRSALSRANSALSDL